MAAIPLDTLQHVGVVGDHHVGAGVDGGLRDPAQERALDLGELEAAVELGDDDVGAFVAQPLDLGGHGACRVGGCAAVAPPGDPVLQLGICRRGRDRRPQLGLPVVGERRCQTLELGPRVAGSPRGRGQSSRPRPRRRTTTTRGWYCQTSAGGRSAGIGSSAVGSWSLTKSPLTVVIETTPIGSPGRVDEHPALRLVRREARTHGWHPGRFERFERRRDARVLPVEGMVVAERDEVDTELVEQVGDAGGDWRRKRLPG